MADAAAVDSVAAAALAVVVDLVAAACRAVVVDSVAAACRAVVVDSVAVCRVAADGPAADSLRARGSAARARLSGHRTAAAALAGARRRSPQGPVVARGWQGRVAVLERVLVSVVPETRPVGLVWAIVLPSIDPARAVQLVVGIARVWATGPALAIARVWAMGPALARVRERRLRQTALAT